MELKVPSFITYIQEETIKDIEVKLKPEFKEGDFVWAVNPHENDEVTGAKIDGVLAQLSQDWEYYKNSTLVVRVEYTVFFGQKIRETSWINRGGLLFYRDKLPKFNNNRKNGF